VSTTKQKKHIVDFLTLLQRNELEIKVVACMYNLKLLANNPTVELNICKALIILWDVFNF
jgi:hypothetical protein